jgi:hypothetical protein
MMLLLMIGGKSAGFRAKTVQVSSHLPCAFNNRALVRDLEEVCCKVNSSGATLPDGRRLVTAVGERLRAHALNGGPLAQTG